jgi:hypothetical protein
VGRNNFQERENKHAARSVENVGRVGYRKNKSTLAFQDFNDIETIPKQ